MRTTTLIPRVFRLLAGDYWAPALAAIGLVPLRFRNQDLEDQYVKNLNDNARVSFRLIAYLTLFFPLTCLGLLLSFSHVSNLSELRHHTILWTLPSLLLLIAISIALFWLSFLEGHSNFFERAIITAYLLGAVVNLAWLTGNSQLSLDYASDSEVTLILHYRYLVAGACFSHLLMYIIILCVIIRVRTALVVPTGTGVLALLWIFTLAITFVFHNAEYTKGVWLLVGLYGMMMLCNFAAAYVNELSDRVAHICARQASDSVHKARRTKRYITKSGLPISPLETLVRDLRKVHTMIDQVKCESDDGPQHDKLTNVAIDLTEILRTLTKGTTLQARVPAELNRDSDEAAAEVFHSLYDTDRLYANADVSRKRESSMFRVAFPDNSSGEASAATCANANDLVCRMDEATAARIGVDLTLTYADLEDYKDHPLFEVGWVLMRPLLSVLGCSSECLKRWLQLVDFSSTPDQPFHNTFNAALSAHQCIAILRAIGVYDELTDAEVVAVTCAALGRFLTQTGRSDSFYTRTNALVAVLWSDKDAVQSMTFQTLLRSISVSPECNILAEVPEDVWRDIRHFVADLILDMSHARHFATLSRIRVLRHAPDRDKPQQRQIIRRAMCTAAMKVAVAPQTLLSWQDQIDWGLRWAEERYQQGDDERILGLRVSPMNDRNLHQQFPKTCIDYLTVMWMPLWRELCRHDTSQDFYSRTAPSLEANMSRWGDMYRAGQTVEIPEEVKQLKIGASLMPVYISARLWRARSYTSAFAETIKLNLVEE